MCMFLEAEEIRKKACAEEEERHRKANLHSPNSSKGFPNIPSSFATVL